MVVRIVSLFILFVLGLPLMTFGQGPASTSIITTANAVIVKPIDISIAADIHFGSIAAGATEGTITLNPGGTLSYSGGVFPVDAGDESINASFEISGEPNGSVGFTLPFEIALINPASGLELIMNDFLLDTGFSANLDNEGKLTANLGATLHIGAHQEPGSYSSSFEIMVSYE